MMSPLDSRRRMEAALARATAVLPDLGRLLDALHGKRILASGATGFFGIWLHAAVSFLRASGCDVSLTRLSRSPQAFETRHPQWAGLPWASWLAADALGFSRAEAGNFDFALHMATSTDAASNLASPSRLISETVAGTAGMLDLCERAGARLLMVSSGAVYGKRKNGDRPFSEDDVLRFGPDPLDPTQCYGEAKRLCESMCAARHKTLEFAVVRPFAFLGPYLPLRTHFAAGNFLANAAEKNTIIIRGDGTPMRSYMHPADMICWLLWSMVFADAGKALNVGSDRGLSLAALASMFAAEAGTHAPEILGSVTGNEDIYLPDISRARALGLGFAFELEDIIRDGLDWLASTATGDWQA